MEAPTSPTRGREPMAHRPVLDLFNVDRIGWHVKKIQSLFPFEMANIVLAHNSALIHKNILDVPAFK